VDILENEEMMPGISAGAKYIEHAITLGTRVHQENDMNAPGLVETPLYCQVSTVCQPRKIT
jgi:hypothetical protein